MRRSVFVLVLVLLAILGPTLPARASSVQCDASMSPDVYAACLALQQSQSQQAENAAMQQAIQAEVADLEQKIAENTQLIIRVTAQIAEQQAQVDATRARVAQLDHQIRLTEADIERQIAHIKVREQLLDRRVRATDLHGAVNYLQVIVTSTSFDQLIDRVMIMQQLIRADHQLIADLRDEKARVQSARDALAGERAHQAELLALQQDQENALQASEAQLLANQAYERELEAQAQQQLALLEEQRRQIDAQVAADQAAYDAAAAAAGGGSGQFGWPETYGTTITQGFGCTPYTFEPYDPNCPSKHSHSGLDIGGVYGANVYAADTGIAHLYSSGYGYGNYVVIIHGNGYSSLYGHLAGFNIGDGATVHRGDVIAFEGSTGNSTGPHLHFEIRVNNVPQNPCTYLNPGC